MTVSLEQPSLKMEAPSAQNDRPWNPQLLFLISEVVCSWTKKFAEKIENPRQANREKLLSYVKILASEMKLDEEAIKEALNAAKASKKVLNQLAICEEKLPECAPYLNLLRVHLHTWPWSKKTKSEEPLPRNPQEKCADALIDTIYLFMKLNLNTKVSGDFKWRTKQELIPALAKELGEKLKCRKINKVVKAASHEKVKGNFMHTEDRINLCMTIPEIAPYFEVLQKHCKVRPWSRYPNNGPI